MLTQIYSQLNLLNECAFATSKESQPNVRPMTLIYYKCNFYVATGINEQKAVEIRENKLFAWYVVFDRSLAIRFIRAKGEALIVDDMQEKQDMFDHISFIREYWPQADHQDFLLIKCNPSEILYNKKDEEISHLIKL